MRVQQLVADGRIAADWGEVLAPLDEQIAAVEAFVAAERASGAEVLPADGDIFAAFQRPLRDVRVLIVGQDPYPTPGHSIGLAFATAPELRPIPRSLKNMYRELSDDLGASVANHGDLTHWADQGVMLLNRVLTVRAGDAGSHRSHGWEKITECAIRALASRGEPMVAVLWGNDARKLVPLLGNMPVIESAHPSPLSASRGFFGSKPFSRVNEELCKMGAKPIDWVLPVCSRGDIRLFD